MDLQRREFLAGAGAAASAWAGLGAAGLARAAAALPPHLIVADKRFAAARAFAAEAAWSTPIAWIDGDVSDLWYRTLDPMWRRAPVSIAGMTEYGAFFYIERLAWDRGLRTTRKTEHRHDGARLIGWRFAPKPKRVHGEFA